MELKIRETCPECKGACVLRVEIKGAMPFGTYVTFEISSNSPPRLWLNEPCKTCKGTGKVERWVDAREVFYKIPRR